MDYEEEQSMEMEALESIYSTDFKILSSSPYNFTIQLKPNQESEEANHVALLLDILLDETYPESLPTITVEKSIGLHTVHQCEIKEVIQTQVNMSL